ncbi:MAG: N-formylglutamate amidohydrolase [Methyloligellaceae bacterium]
MIETTIERVLFVREPASGVLPLVFDSPHSGTDYPEDFDTIVPADVIRDAEDTLVDGLFQAAPEHGARLIGALFPRSYCDPNRSERDVDPELLAEPWPGGLEPGPKTALGIGAIWRLHPTGRPMYGRKLTVAEVRHRLDTYLRPYQAAVKQALDELYGIFGGVWHVNCHSMPAVSTAVSKEGAGVRRPDFCIGDGDGVTCDPAFTALAAGFLADAGYEVTVNTPYQGAELVRAWPDPTRNRHSLLIEVNRRLYLDETTREPSADFGTTQRLLTGWVAALADFVRDGLG